MIASTIELLLRATGTSRVVADLSKVQRHVEGIGKAAKGLSGLQWAGIAGGIMAAGAAGTYMVAGFVNKAAELQSQVNHLGTAMGNIPNKAQALAQAQKFAEDLASKTGISAGATINALYIATSNGESLDQAMATVRSSQLATIGTTANLNEAMGQLNETTRTASTLNKNFGINTAADLMSQLQTKYAFGSIGEVSYALNESMGGAKSAGMTAPDLMAGLAIESESGLHGERAGAAINEIVSTFAKGKSQLRALMALNTQGGLDLGKTVTNIAAHTAGMTKAQRLFYLHQIGFSERSAGALSLLLDKSGEYANVVNDLNHSQGAAANAAKQRLSEMGYQWGQFLAKIDRIQTAIGNALKPAVTELLVLLNRGAQALIEFGERHRALIKSIIAFAANAAIVEPIKALIAILRFAYHDLRAMYQGVMAVAHVFSNWKTEIAGVVGELEHMGHVAAGLPVVGRILNWMGGGGGAAGGAIGMAMPIPALAGGGAHVTHYSPTVHVTVHGDGDEGKIRAVVHDELRSHASEHFDSLKREGTRRARAEFD